jgi:hypothetical protein
MMTARVSQCFLRTMCSQREEPGREMSSEQEADLRAFYDGLMRQLQAEGWDRGWAAVKAQILDVVTEVNRHVTGFPAGGAGGPSDRGPAEPTSRVGGGASAAAVSSDTSASSMRASAASGISVHAEPVGRARRSRTAAQPPATHLAGASSQACRGASASAIGAACGAAGCSNVSTKFEFVVSGTGPRAHVLQAVVGQSLLCGRFGLCDCLMGHEERRGVVGENLHIGRVQARRFCSPPTARSAFMRSPAHFHAPLPAVFGGRKQWGVPGGSGGWRLCVAIRPSHGNCHAPPGHLATAIPFQITSPLPQSAN